MFIIMFITHVSDWLTHPFNDSHWPAANTELSGLNMEQERTGLRMDEISHDAYRIWIDEVLGHQTVYCRKNIGMHTFLV